VTKAELVKFQEGALTFAAVVLLGMLVKRKRDRD
jgi:hypothetical protein